MLKKCDLESVFGVVGFIFKPGAASLPQGPLSLCFGQLKHPERHHLANRASEWHFNAKFGQNAQTSKYSKSQKINILEVGMTWRWVPHAMRPTS